MTFDTPEIRWPDQARGSIRFDEALNVGDALTEDAGLAYIQVALISEQELVAGRIGSPLHLAASGFMTPVAAIALV